MTLFVFCVLYVLFVFCLLLVVIWLFACLLLCVVCWLFGCLIAVFVVVGCFVVLVSLGGCCDLPISFVA